MYLHYLKKRQFDGMFHGLEMGMGSHSECKCTVSVLFITCSQQLLFSALNALSSPYCFFSVVLSAPLNFNWSLDYQNINSWILFSCNSRY